MCMVKRIALALILLAIIIAAFLASKVLLPNGNDDAKAKYLYVYSGRNTRAHVMQTIRDSQLLRSPLLFERVAEALDVWDRIRPGRYELSKSTTILNLARRLRNGTQSPVDLTITKIRTKEQLASMIGKRFETDSASMIRFLSSPDSVGRFELDTNTVMAAVFPDTYTYRWTATPSTIFEKLHAQYKKIWTSERKQKAEAQGLTPIQTYILASIIEEETNVDDEKGNMASVYMNRLKKGMRLGADPTVKFALRDFDLRRIYQKHLQVESPYNTYRNTGLPPGPICTPSLKTVDAVLNAPQTEYLYFVAKSDFSQRHVFTTNYADHLKFAREYQVALNARQNKGTSTAKDIIE